MGTPNAGGGGGEGEGGSGGRGEGGREEKKNPALSVLFRTQMNIHSTTYPFLQPLSTVDSDNTITPAHQGITPCQPSSKGPCTIQACHPGTRHSRDSLFVCLLVGCLTSQQHASVSQGRIRSDKFMCCHTEIEVADQFFYLTQSQYTDTGPTSPSTDPITPGAWQGSYWSANF